MAEEKSDNSIVKSFEEGSDKDLFDDLFGQDAEREQARKRMKEKIEEEKEKLKKKQESNGNENSSTSSVEEKDFVEVLHEVDEKVEKMAPEKKENVKEILKKKENSNEKILKKEKNAAEKIVEEKYVKTVEKKEKAPQIVEEKSSKKTVEKEKEAEEKGSVEENDDNELIEDEYSSEIKPELKLLPTSERNSFFIGRKKSTSDQYGDEGALFVGKVNEENALKHSKIFVDGLNPHVIFVCGARGTGKSYIMGIIAEELALKNSNVGIIVIDPIGVFWSMRFPNKEEKELKLLKQWGLDARGLKNLHVFIPEGMSKQTPKGTYDDLFSMQPSLLTAQDWCLTFGIERFSPTGLLLEKSISKVKEGFRDVHGRVFPAKKNHYGLDDLIYCLEFDVELNSKDRGYKHDSIRALTSRFEAAKAWGIFSKAGTPLIDLSKENQLTVIDTSFLDDAVSALIIGILARRLLAARKLATRREAAEKFESEKVNAEEILEGDVPATWMFIDEAHTLIPSGNIKTPATDALVEYVKQGRRPGCSLVFATQQPSAIDSKVLSQLDIIITHKLVFNDDIKAIFKRTPTIIPFQYKRSSFIKTLPMGTALVGDRTDTTSRAFVLSVRPRMSQHEGREAETIERKKTLPAKVVTRLIGERAFQQLSARKSLRVEEIEKLLEELNKRYNSDAKIDEALDELMKRGAYLNDEDNMVSLIEEEPIEEEKVELVETDIEEEGIEEPLIKMPLKKKAKDIEFAGETVQLLSFPQNLSEKNALKLINKYRQKALLGVLGSKEFLDCIELKCVPVYKVDFNHYTEKNQFTSGNVFINSLSGEFLHFKNKAFIESDGLKAFYSLSQEKIMLVNNIGFKERSLDFLAEKTAFSAHKLEKMLDELKGLEIVAFKQDKKGLRYFFLKRKFDLPRDLFHPLVSSVAKVPLVESDALFKLAENYSKKDVIELLKRMWPNIIVQRVNEIFWPVYEGTLKSADGKVRKIYVDAVSGKKINPME